MTPEQFDQMIRVAEARYHKAFDDIRPVLDQEARIRRDLKQLDDQQARNRKMLDGEVGLRAIGADILWQGWTEKARRELNTELAQVLASSPWYRIAAGKTIVRAISMVVFASTPTVRQYCSR